MKHYRLTYKEPYLFDDGDSGGGKDLCWQEYKFEFDAEDDAAAQQVVADWFKVAIVALRDRGTIEHHHCNVLKLEEMPRNVALPDLPMNGKQIVAETA